MRNAVLGTLLSTHSRAVWVASVLLVLPFFCICLCSAQDVEQNAPLKIGPEFKKQLQEKLSIKWSEVPLRAGLERLGAANRVAILLDRRIDPNQTLELTCQDLPLEQIVQLAALRANAATHTLANVIYVGPLDTAASLASANNRLRQHMERLPPAAKRYWLGSNPSPSLAEGVAPEELVQTWFKDSRVSLINPDILPHDVWPAVAFPSISRQDQLSLILAGFSLTCEVRKDGTEAQLAPIPKAKTYLLRLPFIAGLSPDTTLTQVRTAFPMHKIRREGNCFVFDGTIEEHATIRQLLLQETPAVANGAAPPANPADKRFTLTAERQAAGAVLKAVAQEQGLTLVYPQNLLGKLKEHVTIRVKNITLEELLEDILKPIGLKAVVDEKNITISKL